MSSKIYPFEKTLAKLLKKYGIKGTFYISPKNREFSENDLLSDREIVKLSKDFEIGAHTMTHPILTKINKKDFWDSSFHEIPREALFPKKDKMDQLATKIHANLQDWCSDKGFPATLLPDRT